MRLGGLDLRTSRRGLGLSVFSLLIALGGTALGVGRGRQLELGSGTKRQVGGGRLGCSWGSLQHRDRLGDWTRRTERRKSTASLPVFLAGVACGFLLLVLTEIVSREQVSAQIHLDSSKSCAQVCM